MSLVGNLEDLPLTDILQIVTLSKRSGILTVDTQKGIGVILFKNGLIVGAKSPSSSVKNLGEILLEQKILNQQTLTELLELQKARGNEPLGSIVVKAGIIDKNRLQTIVKNQIKDTLYDLMALPEGHFSFDLRELIPFDDIRFNPMETSLERGLNPQQVIIETARLVDEKQIRDLEIQTLDVSDKSSEKIFQQELPAQRKSLEDDTVRLEDLQLPETKELPDIAFDKIAQEVEFATKENYSPEILPVTHSGPVVLLVDDEAMIRQVMLKRLQAKGFTVFQSDNVTEAVQMAEDLASSNRNPWLIVDLVMPTTAGNGFLGGLEIVEAIRRKNSNLPIILISDYEDPKATTRALTLGVQHFRRKPAIAKFEPHAREDQLLRFTDELVEAFDAPPHQMKAEAEDFWSDLGVEAPKHEPTSALHMMEQMKALRQIIEELRNPNEAPEISLLILRYAAEFFDRAGLFLVKKTEVNGLGGFGETGGVESMPQKVRNMKISLSVDSIFSRTVRKRNAYLGKLPDTPANRQFLAATGHLIPPEIAVMPLISRSEVIAILYGDNAVTKRPIHDLEGLEIFMIQAGIAMENALLQRKIQTLKFK